MYVSIAVSTRPDIAYAVYNPAHFNSNPQKRHWTALKQVRIKVSQRHNQLWNTLQTRWIRQMCGLQ